MGEQVILARCTTTRKADPMAKSRSYRRTRRRSAQTVYGLLALGALVALGGALYLWLGWGLYPLWLVVSSVVAFGFLRYDKGQAQRPDAPRVPEIVLLALIAAGGVVGGAAGMYMRPRHKTNKPLFAMTLLFALILHVYLLYRLLRA